MSYDALALLFVSYGSGDEIAKAPGISKKLAELIYATLHSE